MHVRKTAVLLALLVSLAAASASARTINFASQQANSPDPELPGALTAGTLYTQQGFAIASIGVGHFDVWKLGNSNFPGTSSAATSLFEVHAGDETQITYGQSQPFTLDSIDFAPLLSGGSGPFTILVTGVFPDESFTTQMVTINNSPFRLQTVKFSGFTNVVAVNFLQGTSAGNFTGQETAYQFNNIVVNNRYVNGVNGKDSNDCLSVQTACQTIGHAISLASSGDSIIVAAATYSEGLSIGKNLNILGSGCSGTIINGSSGSGVAHVVTISNAAVVTLSGLSIRGGGSGSTAGGGIYNAGTLILNNSCVDGNHVGRQAAGLATGGGIYNASVLTINNSELSGNTAVATSAAGASGGGIYNRGRLTINYSTIKQNSSSGSGLGGEYGGGISNDGTLTINNTTLPGNSANGSGGGIYNGGTLTISNATIYENRAINGGGGGIDNLGTTVINNSTISQNSAIVGGGIDGSATLQNSIVASNTASSGGNCSGAIVSNGYNLSSDNTCNFNKTGDLNNIPPVLGPLQNNGGPTWTMALLPGSPAIDAGNPTGCTDGHGHLLKTDQRGQPRPDSEDKTKTGCDMGAYEK